jgi:predicted methyltransferase
MRRRKFFTVRGAALGTLPFVATAVFAAGGFIAPSSIPPIAFPKPDRPIADIVSPIWRGEKERDAAREPQQLVRLLDIKPGMTVADIGAGSGYYVARLAPIVGPGGLIIAEDVVPEYLRGLRDRVKRLHLRNVTVARGEPHDPLLSAHSVDVAILVHMYHEITQPYGLLFNLAPAFKPGGRLGIVDASGPISEHGTPPGLLRCELAVVGYSEVGFHQLEGSNAYLAVFSPPSDESRPRPDAMTACKG